HLSELMLPDHPARILAGGAGFRAEAGRAGREAQRQLGLVEDRLAHEIREWDFGSGNEPEILSERRALNRTINKRLKVDLTLPKLLLVIISGVLERVVQQFRSGNCSRRQKLVIDELRQLRCAKHHMIFHQ